MLLSACFAAWHLDCIVLQPSCHCATEPSSSPSVPAAQQSLLMYPCLNFRPVQEGQEVVEADLHEVLRMLSTCTAPGSIGGMTVRVFAGEPDPDGGGAEMEVHGFASWMEL
ncbi:hypothetical protein ABPG75_013884 [Micractinium tetrahymenae]